MFLKLSRFFLYLSVFSVVIVAVTTFFPFIGGKYYFFRSSIELAVVCLLLFWAFEASEHETKEIVERAKQMLHEPIFIAVSVFVIAFMLAVLFAYDMHAAFWSNYERGEGGFQMLHYYFFFAMTLLLLDRKEYWRAIFKASTAAAVLMILYGIGAAALLQNFIGPYAGNGTPIASTLLGRIFSPGGRFQGSLGNPAYVAPYLMFAMFYALYLWLIEGTKKAWRNWLYAALILVFFIFFFLSQTRGAFFGLIVATFASLAYLFFYRRSIRKVVAIVFGTLMVVGGIIFYYRDTPLVQSLPGARLFSFSLSSDSATRLWTWGSAWRGFKERPILGWGPENFSTAFDKYFDTRHYVVGKNSETWFDRAHSVVFDYLSETGIVGLLSYLGIFVVFYRDFFRKRKDIELDVLFFALPIAYFVQGLILFDVLPIYINLFLFLAFANVVFYGSNHESNN